MIIRWSIAAVLNLLLGCLAIIPFCGLGLFAINFPLAALGLTERAPTENDGMLPWLVVLLPLITVVLVLWILANAQIQRRTSLPTRPVWLAGSMLIMLPTAILMIGIAAL